MAANILVDASYLVAILTDRDTHHRWADSILDQHPPPWKACEAVISEAFYLLAPHGVSSLVDLLRRDSVICEFQYQDHASEILSLMQKYASVPMSFADACLVRMSETISQPIVLTTDTHFRIYRRHGRQTIPCVLPD